MKCSGIDRKQFIDLNYEEVSCDRAIFDGAFANGLQNFRFNIAPSSGLIPSMSYFLVEYNFGSAVGKVDNYTSAQALDQKDKITSTWLTCFVLWVEKRHSDT